MAEPQTTPQEGDTSHLVEPSPLEQAGSNEKKLTINIMCKTIQH